VSRALTLKRKLFLLQILALIPWFLGLGYLVWRSWPEIRILQEEIQGGKHLTPYIKLINILQRHRGLYFLYANLPQKSQDPSLKKALVSLEEEFQKSADELEGLILQEDHHQVRELSELEESFYSLRVRSFSGDPEESFWRHTRLIERLLVLTEAEGHRHGLFSDPDIYVRTLAEVALIEIPKLAEILGRIRGLGSGYLARRSINPAERRQLLRLYAVAHGYAGALEWTVKNIQLPRETVTLLQTGSEELESFLKHSEDLITRESLKGFSARGYFERASQVIETFYEIYFRLTRELVARLKRKQKKLFREWLLSSLIFSGVFTFLCLAFYLSYRSIIRKLSIIMEGVQRIAEGDLSARIDLPPTDEIGRVAQVLNQSVEKLRKNLQEIYFLHYYDRLTELPNRDKLLEDLRGLEAPALILLDIHNFKDLNFVCGEECGDLILRDLALRLREIFPTPVYRIGPDEFAVVFDLARRELSREEFFALAEKGLRELEGRPFLWQGEEVYLSFFGAAVCECVHPEKVLIFAYDALKEAKESRTKLVRVASPVEKRRPLYEERMLWIRKTRVALREDRILPFYQPILNNRTGKVEKFEALVRLIDEDGTVIPPSRFLEVSQKMGLYPEITRRVVEKALRDFRDLPFDVSINLSFEDFESQEVKEFLLHQLIKSPVERLLVEPQKLVFEVVETGHIRNYEMVVDFLKRLKERGCRIAIDDFGTGYSNLERLIELRVDYLKIDASLIRRLPGDETVRLLVEAILQFARRVGIRTIAEFVSDERIFNLVRELGIDYSQGYFVGKPEPIEVIRNKYL